MNLREEDLRSYIEERLKQKGIKTEREVACGNGVRADLVTSDTVIEVKKQLNRGAIYQAYGQGVAYQTLLKKPKLIIIGLAPSSEARYQEAQRIAENVRNDGVQVIFIDKDPKWGLTKAAIAQLAGSVEPSGRESSGQEPSGQPVKAQPAKATVRLPFDIAAADLEGAADGQAPAKSSGGGGESDGKAGGKTGKSAESKSAESKSAESSERKPAVSLQDVWSLLLIILLFLWVRAFLWQATSPITPDGSPVQPVDTPQSDPSPPPFTVPSVPQK